MLNTMLEWVSPVIGWASGLDMIELLWMMLAAGVLPVVALASYAVMLKLANRDLRSDLAWWQDRYRSLTLQREEDNDQAFKAQQVLRINLIKVQDDLSQACDSFNEYMAIKDARVRQLQGQLKSAKLELECTKAALKMSGKIHTSYMNLLDYLDKHCSVVIRDEKGKFNGSVRASSIYDRMFKHEIYKGDI